MKLELYIQERDELRRQWRDIRSMRLDIKIVSDGKGCTSIEIRHNADYKRLKKEQKHISKMIKHIENKICREMKNEA